MQLVLLASFTGQHKAQVVPYEYGRLPQGLAVAASHRPVLYELIASDVPLLAGRLELLDVAQLKVVVRRREATLSDVSVPQLPEAVETDELLLEVLLLCEVVLADQDPRRSLLELLEGVLEGLLHLGR